LKRKADSLFFQVGHFFPDVSVRCRFQPIWGSKKLPQRCIRVHLMLCFGCYLSLKKKLMYVPIRGSIGTHLFFENSNSRWQGTLWFEAGTQGMVPQAQDLSIVSRLLSPLAVEKQAFAVLFPGRQASHWSAS